MNFPFQAASPYIQAAMAQAVQAMMSGGPLPPNCVVMTIPYQSGQPIFPPMMMGGSAAGTVDGSIFPPSGPFFGAATTPSPYGAVPPTRALVPFAPNGQPTANYNYPIVSKKSKKKAKKQSRNQPHSNIYNSSSFDTYMRDLSWSRLFDHHSTKNPKQASQEEPSIATQDDKSSASRKQRSTSSSSSTSSTTSDETIRRVNVNNQQNNNLAGKQTTKGTLPFKYSSEFIPGVVKGQQQQPQPQPQPQQQQQQQQGPPAPSKGRTNESANVKKA